MVSSTAARRAGKGDTAACTQEAAAGGIGGLAGLDQHGVFFYSVRASGAGFGSLQGVPNWHLFTHTQKYGMRMQGNKMKGDYRSQTYSSDYPVTTSPAAKRGQLMA